MTRLTLTLAALALAVTAFAQDKKGQPAPLAELKKLAGPLDEKSADLDAEEVKELWDRQGQRALELVKKFEADSPRSEALNDARMYALLAISRSEKLSTADEPAALAKRLREATKKSSDHAAGADMFLVAADIRRTLREAKSGEDFVKAWNSHAPAFRKMIAAYLKDHPKYRPAADALRGLVPLLDLAGDTETRDLIVARVAENLPDHPLARAAALQRAVGKDFTLSFKPAGGDKEVSMKDLRGKVVVVYFYTSWCVPCRAAQRQLSELYKKHHKEGLEVIGVSLDESDEAAKRYLKRHDLPWKQVIGKEARAIGEKFGIETIPVQMVVDREGKLLTADAVGKLPQLLPKLLGEKK